MEQYLTKQKELNELVQSTANEIVTKLISSSIGKTVKDLRRMVLDFIQQNRIPEDISYKVKREIEEFISNIEIPVQNN